MSDPNSVTSSVDNVPNGNWYTGRKNQVIAGLSVLALGLTLGLASCGNEGNPDEFDDKIIDGCANPVLDPNADYKSFLGGAVNDNGVAKPLEALVVDPPVVNDVKSEFLSDMQGEVDKGKMNGPQVAIQDVLISMNEPITSNEGIANQAMAALDSIKNNETNSKDMCNRVTQYMLDHSKVATFQSGKIIIVVFNFGDNGEFTGYNVSDVTDFETQNVFKLLAVEDLNGNHLYGFDEKGRLVIIVNDGSEGSTEQQQGPSGEEVTENGVTGQNEDNNQNDTDSPAPAAPAPGAPAAPAPAPGPGAPGGGEKPAPIPIQSPKPSKPAPTKPPVTPPPTKPPVTPPPTDNKGEEPPADPNNPFGPGN